MDVLIVENAEAVARRGFAYVRHCLSRKPDAVIGLATGSTPLALYAQLVAAFKNGELSFAEVRTFNLDEYLGLSPDHPQSYSAYMQRELFAHIDIQPHNAKLPVCEHPEEADRVCEDYEKQILAAGGIDLQILGIGENGHIGFNEPASSLASRTRLKTLTRGTLEVNARFFETGEKQPEIAITMGIRTILDAREIVLMASGERKAAAVAAAIEGPVSALCPASALQLHAKVTAIVDRDAATRLQLEDFYEWTAQQNDRLGRSLR